MKSVKARPKKSKPKRRRTLKKPGRSLLILAPGEGRTYSMGRIQSVFKADATESAGTYSVSEWWLKPNTAGPGTHAHDEDHVYYILDGEMNIFAKGRWKKCPKSTFILIPGGMPHNFENRGSHRSGMLVFNNKAGFESHMPGIVDWFAENPPGFAK
jgi:mannose-6-phosphate isomerase-like protein (cupin superfamily)